MQRRSLLTMGADCSGATVVEFALASVLLSLMLAGLVDLGLGLYSQSRVDAAAQAGLRYAQAHGYDQQGITQAIQSGSSLNGVTANPAPQSFCGCISNGQIAVVSCSADCESGRQAGRYVRSSAQATYQPFMRVPGLPTSYNLTASTAARVQ